MVKSIWSRKVTAAILAVSVLFCTVMISSCDNKNEEEHAKMLAQIKDLEERVERLEKDNKMFKEMLGIVDEEVDDNDTEDSEQNGDNSTTSDANTDKSTKSSKVTEKTTTAKGKTTTTAKGKTTTTTKGKTTTTTKATTTTTTTTKATTTTTKSDFSTEDPM